MARALSTTSGQNHADNWKTRVRQNERACVGACACRVLDTRSFADRATHTARRKRRPGRDPPGHGDTGTCREQLRELYLQAGGLNLLFDAGRGASVRLEQMGVSLGNIDVIFITHFQSSAGARTVPGGISLVVPTALNRVQPHFVAILPRLLSAAGDKMRPLPIGQQDKKSVCRGFGRSPCGNSGSQSTPESHGAARLRHGWLPNAAP
jgi:hypothetical protein